MIAQVALTAMAIPAGIEGAGQAIRRVRIHEQFPSHEYFTARLELDRPAGEEMTSAFDERRARTYSRLEQQIAEEPDVVAVTFTDRQPGGDLPIERTAYVESRPAPVMLSQTARLHRTRGVRSGSIRPTPSGRHDPRRRTSASGNRWSAAVHVKTIRASGRQH